MEMESISQETIEVFLDWLKTRGRSSNTVKAYGSDLRVFLTEAPEMLSLTTIEDEAMRWLNRHREALTPKTTGRRLTALRSFLRFLGIRDPLFEYIAPKPARPQAHPIPEGLDGVKKLLVQCRNDRQCALVALTGMLGLRISEAINVKYSDFNLDEMTLTIRGKGDRTRVIPVDNTTWRFLRDACLESFISNRPTVVGFKDRFARQLIKNLGIKAQLSRDIASHDLRATFATDLNDRGVNIRLIQELLGHASVKDTQVYTNVTLDQMRQAVSAR